ncbi:hypothetical protein [Enterococcus saccharolyticus]|uniref:Uncharacterized protein n=1 Tax=Enterococcus saccharolyticus subsp. saccharolyticus ATCC 43076 TaxID=1139996 RepID=S0JG11_9ENTE|nr:hypothetical protein [Enterococcus saccharolyticus]EOT25901.1 hypothetical protein OMQ_02371 [Enterococcus saccharolyticus subsp. saccharolyticus ATCC 43076]EOT82731.1 hypothetical protein I572_00271 [Enterococcus saccharolyticus subsp. saccharolyticus ATCC 43076]OJG91096.1 hypothetical protein RV16_GL000082 [Enterococcus saccharolyticus]
MKELVYVHIDTISNAVLTQGITIQDFHQGIVHQPKNLLLLNPSSDLGDYEAHTAMKVVRGNEAVENYFRTIEKIRPVEENKWIDFTDLAMLKELTPLEISELLYFGHMKTHLHSPFFYKLQNNFVYFDLKDNIARTYYRYLDEFYRILASKLTRIVFEIINQKRGFLRKPRPVEKLNVDLVKSLRELMREGLVFSFDQAIKTEDAFQIPIFVVEDTRFRVATPPFKEDALIGQLSYDLIKNIWQLDIDEDHLAFASLSSTHF